MICAPGSRGQATRQLDGGLRAALTALLPRVLRARGFVATAGGTDVASRCQYGSMIVACMVYPASPSSFRCACVRITPVTHTGSNSSFSG